MQEAMEDLRSEWDYAVEGFSSAEISNKWWSIVETKYTAAERKYHNQEYLKRTFELFNEHKDKIKDPRSVVIAIFFQK